MQENESYEIIYLINVSDKMTLVERETNIQVENFRNSGSM